MSDLMGRLNATHESLRSKHLTLRALEELRRGILSGKRVDLPSVEREHLQQGYPLMSEISVDTRHKPVFTNVSRHLTLLRAIGDVDVKFFHFLPLKKSSSGGSKGGTAAMLVIIDMRDRLSLYSFEGELLVDRMELGHETGREIQLMTMSPSQDNHFIVTGDDAGELRHHSLKVVAAKKEPKKKSGKGSNDIETATSEDLAGASKKKQPSITVTPNFTMSMKVAFPPAGEAKRMTAMIAIDRGSQPYYVLGDSAGGISVFFRNGTLKGRVRVTEDFGGVKGLLRGQGQTLLFFSSHSFGFFSVSQIDVQSPLCSGWNSPALDVAVDPSMSYNKVMLGLADGDVVVFTTTRGKSKACDLTLKFPRMTPLPFKLHVFRGHVIGLPVYSEEVANKSAMSDVARDMYFFNVAAMEAGFGSSPTKAVTLQANFMPKRPLGYTLLGGASGSGDGGKAHVAVRFEGRLGIELYELSLKPPPSSKASSDGGGSSFIGDVGDVGDGGSFGNFGESNGGDSALNWLNRFPKIGVFGLALVGVVIWNVRKVTAQRKHETSVDDFDDSLFKEKLRERRERSQAGDDNEDDGH